MTKTDWIILACVMFYFIRGWGRGLLGTIIGPLSFVIGTILSVIYYFSTHNFLFSLLIALIAPFIIDFILSLIFGFFKDPIKKKQPAISLGRILGAIVSSAWGIFIIALWVILLMYIPDELPGIKTIQDNIRSAKSYIFLKNFTKDKIPEASVDFKQVTTVLADPKSIERLQSTNEYKDVIEDSKVQAFLNDQETIDQIQKKDYLKMMSNPKLLSLLNDQEILEKFMKLQKKITQLTANSTSNPKTTK